jgi:RHS repeat-associated protein
MLDSIHSGGFQRTYEYNSGLYHGGTDQVYAIVTDSGGSPLVRYVQRDGLGNVTGIMRNTTLVQFTRYTAWGQGDASPINTLADTNRLGWKGLMYEPDSTKLYFARNRWYDPVAGRFVSEDPVGLAGGTNLYTFAGNNPVNGLDPFGLASGLIVTSRPLPIAYAPAVLWRPPPPSPPSIPASGPGSAQWQLDSIDHVSPPGCSNFTVAQCDGVKFAINQLEYETPDTQCFEFGEEAGAQLNGNLLKFIQFIVPPPGIDGVIYGNTTPVDQTQPNGTQKVQLTAANWVPGDPATTAYNLFDTIAHEESHVLLNSPDPNSQGISPTGEPTGATWGQTCVDSFIGQHGVFSNPQNHLPL